MKNNIEQADRIIHNSPELIRNTQEYQQQVEKIKDEISRKYFELNQKETNIFKRLLLKINKRLEIKRAINQLTSPGNLFLVSEQF